MHLRCHRYDEYLTQAAIEKYRMPLVDDMTGKIIDTAVLMDERLGCAELLVEVFGFPKSLWGYAGG